MTQDLESLGDKVQSDQSGWLISLYYKAMSNEIGRLKSPANITYLSNQYPAERYVLIGGESSRAPRNEDHGVLGKTCDLSHLDRRVCGWNTISRTTAEETYAIPVHDDPFLHTHWITAIYPKLLHPL